MPIDPRIPAMVQVPQIADPLETMSRVLSLRDLASRERLNAQELAERERELVGQRVLRETFSRHTEPDTNSVNYRGVVTDLNKAGYPDLAQRIQAEWHEGQEKALEAVTRRVTQHGTIFGKGAQLLQEVERDPSVYPRLRPRLLELATAVDPSLANEIPETYDQGRVRGMLQFTLDAAKEAEVRARGLERLAAARKETEDALKREKTYRDAVGDWFSLAKNAQDWTLIGRHARDMGVPDSAIAAFGEWSPEAPARAAVVAGQKLEGVTTRDAAGRETTQYLPVSQLPGKKFVKQPAPKAEGMSGVERRALADAVIKNPSLWTDLTQTAKSDIAVELFGRGFTFPKGEGAHGVSERARQAQIQTLNKEYRESKENPYARMSDDAYYAARRGIEDSYRVQIGEAPLTEAEWTALRASGLRTDVAKLAGAPPPAAAGQPTAPPPADRPGAPKPGTPPRADIALPAQGHRVTTTTGIAPGPALSARVKEILRANGFLDDDANVERFLKNPANRKALGLPEPP